MKCPNDQAQMELGIYSQGIWQKTNSNKTFNYFALRVFARNVERVSAWRCPKCGKIELYSNVNTA